MSDDIRLPPDDTVAKLVMACSALLQSEPADRPHLQREYLVLVAQLLAAQGHGGALAVPVLDLVEDLENREANDGKPANERREGLLEASDDLLARVVAVIDVLIAGGYSVDHACQTVTRQMLARAVRPPAGGDARAWRNVQAWRQRLLARREGPLWSQYAAFKDAMLRAFGADVMSVVTRETIWERRHPAVPEAGIKKLS